MNAVPEKVIPEPPDSPVASIIRTTKVKALEVVVIVPIIWKPYIFVMPLVVTLE
jgi:hypothetical protein